MADTTTTNYGWVVPAIGTSAYAPKINTDLQDIDTDLFAVSTAADAAQADATAAQSTADDAFAGKQGITPTDITLTAGDPYVASIDLSTGGPVYRITQSHSYASTDCQITFTNRPATLSKVVYLHFIITSTTGTGNFVPIIQSASKQWAIPMGVQVTTSGTQVAYTVEAGTVYSYIEGTRQVILPVYIVAGV